MTRAAGDGDARPVVNPAKPGGARRHGAAKRRRAGRRPPSASRSRRSPAGRARRSPSARRFCGAPPTSTRPMPSSSSRSARARPARRWPTASPRCARRSTSCATTPPRREGAEAGTQPRGAIVCISPWNFPLAIFTGQIAAALVTGNTVLAKPAEQTPLIAARAVALLHEAGIPGGRAAASARRRPVGRRAADRRSAHRRRLLHRLDRGRPADRAPAGRDRRARRHADRRDRRAQRDDRRFHRAARAGGARHPRLRLPERRPALLGACASSMSRRTSRRRCVEMLKGAMEELEVGDPWSIATDVGPVIDDEAQQARSRTMPPAWKPKGRLIAKVDAPATGGRFVAPHVFRVSGIGEMEREVFGPILHVATFDAEKIDRVIVRHQPQGLWPDLRPAHPHRGARAGHRRRHPCRQHLRQPQPDRRGGRLAALRRRGAVGHRPEGRRARTISGASARSAEAGAELPRARKVTATELADNLPDPALGGWSTRAGPHRDPAQAFARQGRRGDRRCRRDRFRAGRPAGADGRGQHADAVAARAGALPRPGCRNAAVRRRCRRWPPAMPCWPWRRARRRPCSRCTGKGLPIAAIDGRPDPVDRGRWRSMSWPSRVTPRRCGSSAQVLAAAQWPDRAAGDGDALPGGLRARAGGLRRHDGGRRQCQPAGGGLLGYVRCLGTVYFLAPERLWHSTACARGKK